MLNRRRRFERLLLPHLDAAYNLAYWLTGHEQDAQDVVQEAYLRAFKSFDRFVETNALGWLLTIVRNTSYTWLSRRRASMSNVIAFDEAQHSGLADDTASSVSNHGLIQRSQNPATLVASEDEVSHALQALAPIFREVIVLRELEELSYQDIAAIADIPVGTVMSRLARARKQLQQIMSEPKEKHHSREL